MKKTLLISLAIILIQACKITSRGSIATDAVKPTVVTEKVVFDSDDPAIWINPTDTSKSLVIGTDKNTDGGIYAFDLQGKIVNKFLGLKRPNNVDIVYGMYVDGIEQDIAICTERGTNRLRFFSLPDLQPLDDGGLEVFVGEDSREPMGVACYTRPSDHAIFVIVGRKNGPPDGYLWQYRLLDDNGKIALDLERIFGVFSGRKEIESIAVDNELGFVYYSDEKVGIRKYYADPVSGTAELALFGTEDFKADNEGISIYNLGRGKGYILVSNQSKNSFNVYPREGIPSNKHQHSQIGEFPVSTLKSDGSDVTSVRLPGFETGLFVAMSADRTFQYYRWSDIAAKAGLKIRAAR